jgi:hypothetical protein
MYDAYAHIWAVMCATGGVCDYLGMYYVRVFYAAFWTKRDALKHTTFVHHLSRITSC